MLFFHDPINEEKEEDNFNKYNYIKIKIVR